MFGGEFPPLRPFQVSAHEALRQGAREKHQRQVIMAPTGSGKTILAMNVIRETLAKGRRAMFLCDRKTLINQTSEVADSLGLWDHSIIQAGNRRLDLAKPFQIASCQTLMRRGWPDGIDVLVVDECFPAGTLIDGRPIETLKKGDLVLSWNHKRNRLENQRILACMRKKSENILRVSIEGAPLLFCTANHPFFDGEKYVEAQNLKPGSLVYGVGRSGPSKPTTRLGEKVGLFLRYLWRAIPSLFQWFSHGHGGENGMHLPLGEMPGGSARSGIREFQFGHEVKIGEWPSGTHEGQQPHEQPCYQGEDGRDSSAHRAQTGNPWWERQIHSPAINVVRRIGGWLGFGISDFDRLQERQRGSDQHQGRPRTSRFDDRGGGGRREPQLSQGPGARSAQRDALVPFKVVSVEVQEPGSQFQSAGVLGQDRGTEVFNIEVEGNNNYFAEGILVHNCHTLYKTWVDYAMSPECKAMVIGLSATPFAKGMGRVFTNLINATTMHDLTESGVLVPMRIFSCRRPDMTGAETSGGEWTDHAAEERELVIVGDVVTEWHRLAFGKKTIVFGATVKHCEEIRRQFVESGVEAELYTGHTTDDERAEILARFRPHDGALRILVSVEALAKGFDVQDVECICDCRPLRKSLSTAIQMWGRGLRSSPETGKCECVLRGTKIITAKGEKKIEEISLDDKIWDGESFVSHKGAICQGKRNVISYAGLTATADHPVKTKEGWRSLGECAREQIRIIKTGSGGAPIRECEGHFSGNEMDRPEVEAAHALPVQMHNLRSRIVDWLRSSCKGYFQELPTLQPACALSEVALRAGEWDGSAVPEPQKPPVHGLRRAWDRIQIRFGFRRLSLDPRKPRPSTGSPAGSDRQQWALRTRESALVNFSAECISHPKNICGTTVPSIQSGTPRSEVCGFNPLQHAEDGANLRPDPGTMGEAVLQAEGEVWDILDCGPRHCFTANGLLVHNCILLDFSGNIIRFADDFSDVFYKGLDKLDSGEKLDKEIRKDEAKEPKACPKCGYTPMGRKCVGCGYEPESRSLIEHLPGTMREVVLSNGKKLAPDQIHLWGQLATYARRHSQPEKWQGRAAHLFRDIVGTWPPREFRVECTPEVEPTRNTLSKIQSLRIAFIRGRAAA